ncbi:MAG: hypothetical protein ACLFUE_11315 [Desulfobacteraceae bacterium]
MSDNSAFRPMILGQFGPPVLACLRSWGKQGWQPGLICIGKSSEPLPASRHLAASYRLDPGLLYTEEGIRAIRSCLASFKAAGLLCIQERQAMWLDQNRDVLKGFALWVPSADTTKRILSKRRQISTAQAVGLEVLPTYYVDKEKVDVLEGIPEEHFPLCLRPSGEGGVVPSFKVYLARARQEAIAFVQGLERIGSPLIAQPFRNLPNLVVHGARSEEGATYGLQGFLVERKFEGLTLTIRPMELSEDFRKRCMDFTRELGVVGSYHFEFLYDPREGETYFLELNARLGGTTAKVFACGYDEPALALKAYGVHPVKERGLRNVTASSRLALGKYLQYAAASRITELDYPLEPRWKSIPKTLWGMAFYRDDVISFKDLKGTWAFYRQALNGRLGAW